MLGIGELWNHTINLGKGVLEVAGVMIPFLGTEKKPPVPTPLITPVECTCAKVKGTGSLAKSGFNGMGTGGGSMVRLAGLSGAMAVALGAYGAHVIMMDEKLSEEQKYSYRTANIYHFVGTFGLIAAAVGNRPILTGALMTTGTILFSGSCYTYGLTGDNRIKVFAPIGGTTLILAWLSLIL